jgi:hypothetical protein
MPKLFNTDIAGILNKEMGPLLLDLTLKQFTNGTRTVGSYTSGTNPTSTTYSGKGFTEVFELGKYPESLVQSDDKKIIILGASLTVVPKINDEITIESVIYTIVHIFRDAASATYECQGRRT